MSENKKIDLSGDGGVLKEIIQEGHGEEHPLNGCKVSLHYTGKLVDGTVFDSSVEREPFEFDLGKGHVIKAFDMGVATMKLNEKCKLTCAPDYAYGAAGSPPSIPPNSTLIFELEMLGWKGEDVSPNKDGSIERYIVEVSDKKRSPGEGALVKAHITGKYNGNIFEDRDVEFDYGEGCDCGVIEGVEIALEKMTVGETSKLKIQGKYAFGSKGNDNFNIPPNSTVEYIVKLIDCEKGLEEWKLTEEERLQQAELYKAKGTKYFSKQNYALAIKMYKKCTEIISEIDNDESKKLKIASNSNIALCYQKSNDYFEGKQACNEALKLDPVNIKALFRRGQCNLAINEFKEALDDFEKVIELEPTNKAAINQIQICRQRIKEANDKERKIYANMFKKLSAADKQPTPNTEPDVLTKCGEWTDEDAKREVDLAFERDNNIVMI
ncbi:FK506-binding protein 59 isoform X1 [Anastrepha obliqua]|uniref:FK506-binding protein 59 isoform X1 n=2 Tax=Anastrepha obliqua TaxID=95512 RepID=UPI002409D93D|nr:FK506-binding protein 59 isoform X1 [Anastrepha obliqua]